jgi:hypothetical protein
MSMVYLGIGAQAVANDMIIAIGELALSSHPQVQDSTLVDPRLSSLSVRQRTDPSIR